MKKIVLLGLVMISFIANAQTRTFNTKIKLKEFSEPSINDSIVTVNSNNELGFVKKSDLLSSIPKIEAENGVSSENGKVEFGGLLTKPTTLFLNNNNFTLKSGSTGGLNRFAITPNSITMSSDVANGILSLSGRSLFLASGTRFDLYSGNHTISSTTSGLEVNDNTSNKQGITYAADYSTNFVERSLVDKGYVDKAILDSMPSGSGSSSPSIQEISGNYVPDNTSIQGVSVKINESRFHRVGNLVNITADITLDGKVTNQSSYLSFGNLPFLQDVPINTPFSLVIFSGNAKKNNNSIVLSEHFLSNNSILIRPRNSINNVAESIKDIDFNKLRFFFSVTYPTNTPFAP